MESKARELVRATVGDDFASFDAPTPAPAGDDFASFDAPAPGEIAALPQFTAPDGLGQNCQYPAAQEASKANNPPRTGEVPPERRAPLDPRV